MKRYDRGESRRVVTREGDGYRRLRTPLPDESIGELLQSATSDAARLIQLEATLAKAEVKEMSREVQRATTRLALATVVGLAGAVALTAFFVIALGDAIDSYSASALIVGVVLLVVASLVGRAGLARISDGRMAMPRTASSLAEGARWGREELRAFKREFTA